MIEIKVLQAYRGDCIWVRCLEESENINIIIDSGTATFKNKFKNLVEERINLLVFSHIDNDHIKGCIKYVKEKSKKIIDNVWINGSGSNVYSDIQEHSINNVQQLITLLGEKDIPVETPVLEKKEWILGGVKIKVIGPTEAEMLKVATQIENSSQIKEHAKEKYTGNINIIQIHLIQIKHQLSWLLNSKIKNSFLQETVRPNLLLKHLINITRRTNLK